MELIRIPRIVQDTCRKHLMKGRAVGLVPTMGALHDGHLSLIRRSRMENDVTVVSIFVNPAQFGPSEDFSDYPRPVEEDMKKLRDMEVDLLFLPDSSLIYPGGFATYVTVEGLSEKLCGGFRPGHFKGVATVVLKLFNIVCPTRAYFGQKDFQQTAVIRRMAKDLDLGIEVVVCPTVREHDGLAMSSRNAYLSEEERKAAAVLFRGLTAGGDMIKSGERAVERVRQGMQRVVSSEPLVSRIDYLSVFGPDALEEPEEITGEVLLAGAIRIGSTRLIDNILITL